MKNRDSIEEKYKWDLSPIVNGDNEFDSLMNEANNIIDNIGIYQGKLNDNNVILECLNKQSEASLIAERLYVYAKMKLDEDSTISKYQALTDKADRLIIKLSTATSYIVPEITMLSDEKLNELKNDKEFEDFSYFIDGIIRTKKHILSEKEEKLLSETKSFSDICHDAFNMFDNADVNFGKIKYEGEEMQLTHGTYSYLLQSKDRKSRKKAFEMMFTAYKNMINTIAMLYSGNVKKDCFYAKVRGYNSALEKAMYNENVPKIIYDNLIKAVDNNLSSLHEYLAYRKKCLGVKKLNMYDMHTSIIEGENLAMNYEDAYVLVKEALAPLGDTYQKLLDRAYQEKWIDVYENKGKRSGAYSWGSYNAHPYVLLNYTKTTHDIFTIAHELGHAMHSYFSNKTQCFEKAGYEIFVAEVASTVNEVLLLKYLINKASGNEKKYLLCYYLDMFRTTLFRQTQFAEFEAIAHNLYESGESLTADVLCEEYLKLNKKYYGKVTESNDLIKYEWARIPHFYRSFYVYKYATGITSAVVIANGILKNKSNIDKYMKFLSLGGSMPPSEILKVAGVNLEQESTFEIAMNEFKCALDELKSL